MRRTGRGSAVGRIALILEDHVMGGDHKVNPYISLVLEPQQPVLAVLHGWPVLRSILPVPQVPLLGHVHTYWIRVQALPQVSCNFCYEGVLLDTASQ